MSLKPLLLLLAIGLIALVYFLKNLSPTGSSVTGGRGSVNSSAPSGTEKPLKKPGVPPERVALVEVRRMLSEKGTELLRPIGDGPGTIDRVELARLRAEIIEFGKTTIGAERKEFADGVTIANLLDAAASERAEHYKKYRNAVENPPESSLHTEADRARLQKLEIERVEKSWLIRAEQFRKQAPAVFQ